MAIGSTWHHPLVDGRTVHLVMTDDSHGDLAVAQPASLVDARRRHIVDAPWTWLDQIHGAAVVRVTAPGQHAGAVADASFTATSAAALAIQVADCAPVALVSNAGAVGVAHAGWRGLHEGVIEQLAAEMCASGSTPDVAVLGACIGPECYEFGEPDLTMVADRYGAQVRATTTQGTPALDVPAAVASALAGLGIPLVARLGGCTAHQPGRWSHRARGDRERQSLVAWIAPEPA